MSEKIAKKPRLAAALSALLTQAEETYGTAAAKAGARRSR